MRTYSLAEVAKTVLPPDMTNPERCWQTSCDAALSGYRVGRVWRMTRQDVEDLIDRHRNHPQPVVGTPRGQKLDAPLSLTPTSRRSYNAVICDNAQFDDVKHAKAHVMTCKYAKSVDGVNKTRRSLNRGRRPAMGLTYPSEHAIPARLVRAVEKPGLRRSGE
jgi:hypothetical protein